MVVEQDTPAGLISTFRRKFISDDMTRHGMVMVTFFVLAGFFMYLYHLSMAILLEPQEYGALFSLTSLMTILMVFSQAMSTTVSKFTAAAGVRGELGRVNYLWRFFLRRAVLIGIASFTVLSLLSSLISGFLGIDSLFYAIILFSTMLSLFVYTTNQGVLSGLQRFLPLGAILGLQSLLAVTFGVLFVLPGGRIYGGLAAYSLSFLAVSLLSFIPLRKLSEATSEPVAVSGAGSYTGYAVLSALAITVLTNVDAVLARHYLTSADAGSYAVISVLGRVALYAPLGLSSAMFPKTAALFENRGNYTKVFLKAMFLTFLVSSGIMLVYGFFSQPIISFLFRDSYPLVPLYVKTYSLAMVLFGFSGITLKYLLSINQTRVSYVLLEVMLLQLALLALFHAGIGQMVSVMLVLSIVSLLCQLPFHLMAKRQG